MQCDNVGCLVSQGSSVRYSWLYLNQQLCLFELARLVPMLKAGTTLQVVYSDHGGDYEFNYTVTGNEEVR